MKYTVLLIDKNSDNNQVINCETAIEAMQHRRKAQVMGFKVKIIRNKSEVTVGI